MTIHDPDELAPAVDGERFRLLCNATNDALWDWDLVGGDLWWSEGMSTTFGYPLDELEPTIDAWVELIHPDDVDRVVAELDRAVRVDSPWSCEYRMLHRDGTVIWVHDRGTVVRDDAGAPVRMVGGITDITAKRRVEDRELRAQRLEGLGSLASGIAHNLGNVLTPILLLADQLEPELDGSNRQAVAQIRTSTQLATRMCRQILTFARGGGGRREQVEVGPLVDSVLSMVRETFPATIRIDVATAVEQVNVVGDHTQLQQVLLNLFVNARDAMPDGGWLSVASEVVEVSQHVRSPAAPPDDAEHEGPYVRVRVADTGTGIDPQHVDELFDPFFTTKPPGEGTGLGLPTSLAVVQAHGGFIDVDTSAEGTVFDVFLPVAIVDEHPLVDGADGVVVDGRSNGRPPSPTRAEGGVATVLVVEDEAMVARLVCRVVEGAGYEVLMASDGDEALELLGANSVDAVLTDLNVPGTSGEALLDAMRGRDEHLPIVVASGGIGADGMDGAGDRHGVTWLPKPFSNDALLHAVHGALDG
ncbi:MAG: PAS domain-containing protein [Acidimicrobiales bacterium]|nr:PAS domain-containing protein [Acidimicrobiales bacterium]